MDAGQTRLRLLETRLFEVIEQAEAIHHLLQTDGVAFEDITRVKIKLKQAIDRYSNEAERYIERGENVSNEFSITYTNNQIRADDTLAALETVITLERTNIPRPVPESHSQVSRLPTIQLPRFSGDVLKWHEFWDRFQSCVDARNLEDVDKLSYLMAALDGPALNTVEGLDITNVNYPIAVETLTKRFGCKHTLINAHYEALDQVNRSEYKPEDCRLTLNNIERHLRVLHSLGENIDNNYLRSKILKKFPNEVIYEMNLRTSSDRSVQTVRDKLEQIITAMESANRSGSLSNNGITTEALNTHQAAQATHKQSVPRRTRNTRFQNSQSKDGKTTPWESRKRKRQEGIGSVGPKKPRRSCIFCNGDHYNDECGIVKTVDQRRQKLGKRCYNCFREGHFTNLCKIKMRCYHCKGTHNRALCGMKFQSGEMSLPETCMQQIHCTETNKIFYLQTATAKLYNTNNKNFKHRTRLLLDSGSQRSYLTSSMAKKLNLNTDEKDRLMVYTFGADSPNETISPSSELLIETKRGTQKKIRVNIVPHITHRVPIMRLNNPGLIDITADDDSMGEVIDLLIEPDLPLRNFDIKFLWTLESIGITDSPKAKREEEVVKHFNETVKYEGERYYVKWPWTRFPPDLPTNYGLSLGRLRSLCQRIDDDTLNEYDAILREQLELGIIEVIEPQPVKIYQANPPVHYLPHHIIRQTGRRSRIVYDASAKIKDENSLNECLYRGPSMIEDLTALLLQFRTYKIGITADVEKAFLQVGLQKEDRDVTRFLWLKNSLEGFSEDNLLHMRFCRVPFGIVSSPFLLTATIRHHMARSEEELLKKIANKCYVDNLVTGAESSVEACDIYDKASTAFQKLSMNIREWISNDETMMNYIPKDKRIKSPEKVKVLGMVWNVTKDTLQLKHNKIIFGEYNNGDEKSKRNILSSLASLYDPIGIASPIVLPAKLLLQELWIQGIKWDTTLSEELIETWKQIRSNMQAARDIEVPRYVGEKDKTKESVEYQLHGFTDASTQAYAAVIYLRTCFKGQVKTSFIMAKSKLTPLKEKDNLQIPRLELLGYLIGYRLLNYVKNTLELEIDSLYLWTDSQIVLDWLASNKLLPPFIQRRVNEIKQNKQILHRYVNTNFNPADVATRPDLWHQKKELWLNGPEFLLYNEQIWPNQAKVIQTLQVAGEGLTEEQSDTPATDVKKRVIPNANLNRKIPQAEAINKCRDLEEIKIIQLDFFPDEVAEKETSLTRNLGLFLDEDGILRCRGRMTNSVGSYDSKYPILIPRNCGYTDRIIQEVHKSNYHVGTSHTLGLVRERFWIPKGRAQVQKVLKKCPQCIKHGGGPFKLPKTPALPPERVNYSIPFTFTGVDYFGPLFISSGTGKEKRWVCLFTCLAVRAIHMELVADLTADECVLALRRFIASRGLPDTIVSDNALQFKLTSEMLAKPYCIQNNIKWKFIPQLAPWHGGFYERMVGLVKHCMKRTLEKHLLKDYQLLTIVKEIESVINTRPLTCVGQEIEHVLKPADFLTLGKCVSVELSTKEPSIDDTATKQRLIESWKRGCKIIEEFTAMFIGQYLPCLRERYNSAPKQPRVKSKSMPSIGQIVQIKGDHKNRENWKVGKISSLIRGPDGECRVANVRVGKSELTRSIGHLYPLEIEEISSIEDERSVTSEMGTLETRGSDELNKDHAGLDLPELLRESREITIEDLDASTSGRSEIEMRVPTPSVQDEAQTRDAEVTQSRPKREAAVRAREKIAELTRLLFTML